MRWKFNRFAGNAPVGTTTQTCKEFHPHSLTGLITPTSIPLSFFSFKRWAWIEQAKPLLRALAGEAVWPPPIWLMRQAGRYLPEYRALRAEGGRFRRALHDAGSGRGSHAAADPPLRLRRRDPVQRHPDAALGARARAGLREGEGPVLPPLRDEAGFCALEPERRRRLRRADHGDSAPGPLRSAGRRLCRLHADRLRRRPVHRRLLHGRGRRLAGFRRDRTMAYAQPALFDRLMELLTEATIELSVRPDRWPAPRR